MDTVKTSLQFVRAIGINKWGAQDHVDVGDAPLGQTLASLDFEPMLTVRYPHAKFVMQHTTSSQRRR